MKYDKEERDILDALVRKRQDEACYTIKKRNRID
jgi:hypothetical protein